MVQVKKAAVDRAIVEAAAALFRENGFSGTPMAAIARRAGVAVSTIYVYHQSKLDLFFTIYEPWLMERLADMARHASEPDVPEHRVRTILDWIWVKIPAHDEFFSNNLMEAISTAGAGDAYSDGFLRRVQQQIAAMLIAADPARADPAAARELAFLLVMAFDGFAMKIRTSATPPPGRFLDMMAGMICRQLGIGAHSMGAPAERS